MVRCGGDFLNHRNILRVDIYYSTIIIIMCLFSQEVQYNIIIYIIPYKQSFESYKCMTNQQIHGIARSEKYKTVAMLLSKSKGRS